MTFGMRNSLLVALMPTASSAQILSRTECFEPFAELISSRTVLSGQFFTVNRHMVKDLRAEGLWTTDAVKTIIANRGSLSSLPVPTDPTKAARLAFLKRKYLTVYELPQRELIQLSADRAPYVCQSQSLNVFFTEPNLTTLTASHFWGWKLGLKTGMYYLRQPASVSPINMSLDAISIPAVAPIESDGPKDRVEEVACALDCSSCSS
jgi:ribonucleotide reductase alpha subunit